MIAGDEHAAAVDALDHRHRVDRHVTRRPARQHQSDAVAAPAARG